MLVCNAVQYEVGTLTTVCPPVLNIAAFVIKTLSTICSSWLRPNTECFVMFSVITNIYVGWNFNSGNYLFTTDTK